MGKLKDKGLQLTTKSNSDSFILCNYLRTSNMKQLPH